MSAHTVTTTTAPGCMSFPIRSWKGSDPAKTFWSGLCPDCRTTSCERSVQRLLGSDKAWDVAGPVLWHWNSILLPIVKEYFDRNRPRILKKDAWLASIDCWMVGYHPSTAKPTVVITCSEGSVARRLKRLMKDDQHIQSSGYNFIGRRGSLRVAMRSAANQAKNTRLPATATPDPTRRSHDRPSVDLSLDDTTHDRYTAHDRYTVASPSGRHSVDSRESTVDTYSTYSSDGGLGGSVRARARQRPTETVSQVLNPIGSLNTDSGIPPDLLERLTSQITANVIKELKTSSLPASSSDTRQISDNSSFTVGRSPMDRHRDYESPSRYRASAYPPPSPVRHAEDSPLFPGSTLPVGRHESLPDLTSNPKSPRAGPARSHRSSQANVSRGIRPEATPGAISAFDQSIRASIEQESQMNYESTPREEAGSGSASYLGHTILITEFPMYRSATLGGQILVKDQLWDLTVGHIFLRADTSISEWLAEHDSSSVSATSDIFSLDSDGEEDNGEGLDDAEWRKGTSMVDPVANDGAATSVKVTSSYDSFVPADALRIIPSFSMEGDWALLCSQNFPRRQDDNAFDLSSVKEVQRLSVSRAERLEQTQIVLPLRGGMEVIRPFRCSASAGLSLICLPGIKKLQKAHTLDMYCDSGDSGAWVVDPDTGAWYGTVVAYHAEDRSHSYMIPSLDILASISQHHDGYVGLPEIEQRYCRHCDTSTTAARVPNGRYVYGGECSVCHRVP